MKLSSFITYSLSFVAFVVLTTSGCTNTRQTRVTIDTNTGKSSIVEDSKSLRKLVEVIDTTYTEESGLKKAIVTIKAKGFDRVEIQARVSWLDQHGAPVEEMGKPYRAIVLDGGEPFVVTGMAPSPKAVKAIVQIRETKEAQK